MLPAIFPLIASSSACTTLLGTSPVRFHRYGAAPQDTPAPYATWFVVAGIPENTLDEVPRVDNWSVQIDVWSENTPGGSAQAEAVATAIRDALEPHAHMTLINFTDRDPDTKRYRISMQFTFWQSRDATS